MTVEPVKFGNYYLVERVNIGGMAEVFKAVSYGVEGFERLFAVKRVLPNISEDQEFIEMFIDEAKIAVQLNHANIGQIFELGQSGHTYFIAMEFVQGRDLRAIFDRARKIEQPIDIPMACHVIKDVCEALEYAHNKKDERQMSLNLVHRDVSPQNVLVSYDGEVKLVDFGIAKAAGKASRTQAGILKGKFGYMSPEQVRGKPIDRRSDLFALGVVLFELLTLERCFQGESDFSTLEKVRNVDIRRPSSINRNIPPELERILLKALSRNPDDRFQSAAEFQDALQRFLYQSGAFYARKDLASYMRETFKVEFDEEQRKLTAFRDYARRHIPEACRDNEPRPPAQTRPSGSNGGFQPDLPALSWDEEELATTVWDRAPNSIDEGPTDVDFSQVQPFEIGDAHTAPVRRAGLGSDGIISGPGSGVGLPPSVYEKSHRRSAMWRIAILLITTVAAGTAAWAVIDHFGAEQINRAALTVRSEPREVAIAIDGRTLHDGATPFTARDIEPGHHRISISAPGYETIDEAIELEPGVEVNLPIQLVRATPDARTGFDFDTRPAGARAFIDGAPLDDETPFRHMGVAPGPHLIRFVKSGFLPWEQQVLAKSGSVAPVGPVLLRPAKVSVAFLTEPNGAELVLVHPDGDRVTLGPAPQRIEDLDNSGAIRLIATLNGYEPAEQKLTQYDEDQAQVLLTLTRKPGAKPPSRRPPHRPVDKRPRGPNGCRGEDCPPPRPPTSTSRDRVRGDKSSVRATTDPGFLSVTARPPAPVFIDGKKYQWTPIIRLELPAGRHTVSLVREVEPVYQHRFSEVRIEPGKHVLLKYP